jgi:hypothetical protein
MFGLKLRKEIKKLQNSEESLRKLVEAVINNNRYLERQWSRLDIQLEELKMELKNPPKYKVGDQKGWYTVLKVLPLEVASSNRRCYEVLNRKYNVVEGILESTLHLCK